LKEDHLGPVKVLFICPEAWPKVCMRAAKWGQDARVERIASVSSANWVATKCLPSTSTPMPACGP
jgi:hypothetical protein